LFDAGLLACGADVLAGEATANNVSCSRCGEEGGDVSMDGDTGEVLGKDALAVGLPFNKLHGVEAAEPAGSEGEAADAAEGVDDAEGHECALCCRAK
jgi:hypothetical protein